MVLCFMLAHQGNLFRGNPYPMGIADQEIVEISAAGPGAGSVMEWNVLPEAVHYLLSGRADALLCVLASDSWIDCLVQAATIQRSGSVFMGLIMSPVNPGTPVP